jgi:hypothetical protein
MSVQQKLIECEKSMIHSPVDKIEDAFSLTIKNILDSIASNELNAKKESPNDSTNTSDSMSYKDNNNNNNFNLINSSGNRDKIESLVTRYSFILKITFKLD